MFGSIGLVYENPDLLHYQKHTFDGILCIIYSTVSSVKDRIENI